MKLNAGQEAVVKAALIELEREWRKGTSNADFTDETMRLVRGPNGPWPHESTPRLLLDLLAREGAELHIVFNSAQ